LNYPPRVLTIAGSDSSGGAGIQADLKTMTCLHVYGMSAVTAITSQDTCGVYDVMPVSPAIIASQIKVCINDIGVDVIKTGMLVDQHSIRSVAKAISDYGSNIPLVLDPVMVSTSGARLLNDDGVDALERDLFVRSLIVTPNLDEASVLLKKEIKTISDMKEAAHTICATGPKWVLIKGGHAIGDKVNDVLVGPDFEEVYSSAKIDTKHTHGTGCTLASAIASYVAQKKAVPEAVRLARLFVRRAIESAPGLGKGSGPLGFNVTDIK